MKKIDLSRLQNSEHLALMSDMLNLLSEANLEPLNKLKEAFELQITQSKEAQKLIKKSERTQELLILDGKRDDLYRGLVLRVQSEVFSFDQDSQKAAEKLQIVIDTYGNFTRGNYQKETTDIQNFIAELRSEKYLASVQKIGLEQWLNWLETANNTFHTEYTTRRDEYAEQPAYDMKGIRKNLDASFKQIQQTATALEVLQPSEALKVFMAKLNASLGKWKDTIAQRDGKKSAEKSASTGKSATDSE